MVDLLENFLNPLKLFHGDGEQFHEIAMTETSKGYKENDVWRTSYSQSGKRSRERAETKVFANGEHNKKYLIF
jgi:triacylglycerol esterase/lipase EstA (alpha/beta hydrolase family)